MVLLLKVLLKFIRFYLFIYLLIYLDIWNIIWHCVVILLLECWAFEKLWTFQKIDGIFVSSHIDQCNWLITEFWWMFFDLWVSLLELVCVLEALGVRAMLIIQTWDLCAELWIMCACFICGMMPFYASDSCIIRYHDWDCTLCIGMGICNFILKFFFLADYNYIYLSSNVGFNPNK